MGVRVLGRPALVGASGETNEIRGARQMGLLALLVTHRGQTVRNELLHEELWGCQPGGAALRVTVKRLRDRFQAVTGSDPIVSRPGGYLLELDDEAVDEARFGRLVSGARAARSTEGRVDLLWQAEALWVGHAFEGTSDLASVQPEHIRLENLRDDARELLASSLICLGGHSEAIQVLRTVIDRDPFREPAWALKMIALYRSYRQQQALATYEEVRRLLADQIGIQPGQSLASLHRMMLDQVPVDDVGADLLLGIGDQHADDGAGERPASLAPSTDEDLASERVSRAYVDRRAESAKRGSRFVGRAELLAEADRFVAGELDTSLFVLEGPAGIGKTSFGREVAASAGRSSLSVAWGACPRDAGASMVVVNQIMSDLVEVVDRRDATVEAALVTLGPAFPGLPQATVGDPSGIDSPVVHLTGPEDSKARIYNAAEQLLRSAPSPYLVVVDDAHWISPSSASLLSYLADSVPGVRWLIMARNGSRRPGFDQLLAGTARGRAMWHELGPLADDEVASIVSDLLQRTDDHPDGGADLEHLVVDRSGGHPFLAVELARHLADGGDPTSTPRTVEAVVGAEVAGLDDATADLCSAIAVAGVALPVEVLVTAAGLHDTYAESAVRSLLASGLARSDVTGADLWLSHDLVRAAVIVRLDATATRAIHQALAGALGRFIHDLRRPGPGLDGLEPPSSDRHRTAVDVDELRAQHLRHMLASPEPHGPAELDAVASSVLASLKARLSPHEAVRVGADYLAVSGRLSRSREGIEARLHLAGAHYATGDESRARQLIAQMHPQLVALDDPALLADALCTRSPFTADFETAKVLADEGAELLARLSSDDRERRVRVACWVGHMNARSGRGAEAEHAAVLAEAAAGPSPDTTTRTWILTLRYRTALTVSAELESADHLIEDLEGIAAESQDPTAEILVRATRLDRSLRTGTIADYEACHRALVELPITAHHADLRWTAAAGTAALDLARGDLDAAGTSYLRAMELGAELCFDTAMGASMLHRFLLDWDRGVLQEFHPLMPPGPPGGDPVMLAVLGTVHVEAGDIARATEAADVMASADDLLVGAGPTAWQLVASAGAHLAWRTGHRTLAANLRTHLGAHAGRGLSALGIAYLGAADRVLGLTAAAEGDLDRGLQHLRDALHDDQRRGAVRWAGRAARDAAEILEHRDRVGDRDEAAALRVRAEELAPRPPVA